MTDKIPTPGSTEKDKKQAAKRRLSSNPSAAEWQATFDAVNSAIFITDKDCTIVQCNRTTEELFQRPAAEILGKKCYHLVYGADAPISACPLDVTQRTKHRHMLTFKQNDRWFELSVDPILDHAGKCIGSVHVINDITERKQAEQLVQEKEKAYRALFEQTNDAIFIISLEGIHLKVNPRVSEFLGYPTEEIVGRPVVDFIAPEERQDSMEKRFRLLAGEHLPVYERVFMRKDGTRVWGEVNVALVYDEQGKPSHIHSIVRDITERKLAEERLRQSEEKYRDLFQNAPVGLFRSRISDGKILESNDYIAHMFGYASREEFIAEHITAKHYVDPGTRERLLELLYQNGVVENFEARMRRKDGSIFWARFYDRIYPEQGWIEGVVQDITEQKEAQERLRQSEETYRNLFHNAQVGLFRTRISDGKILESNDQLAHMFGYSGRSEFVNQFSTQEHYVDPGTRERMLELIRRDGFIKNFEARFYRKDGSIFWARYSARIYPEQGWIEGVVEDITDQKRAEEEIHRLNAELEARIEERTRQLKEAQEQLVRQEKLAVLGQLAGGVGHELRNPLAVISNAVYFLKLILPEADEKVREYLDILERETRNAEKIISDLLDFARIKSVERQAIPVAELVRRVLERYPAPDNIRLTLDLPSDLPPLWVDPRQIEQVLGNLVLNAYQAMPEGGQLSVIGKPLSATEDLLITVRDTGPGIPPENLPKLFEPLFTTKAHGIGLGLAVSKKLIEANGGRIEVESEPGKGAAFNVILPIAKERQP